MSPSQSYNGPKNQSVKPPAVLAPAILAKQAELQSGDIQAKSTSGLSLQTSLAGGLEEMLSACNAHEAAASLIPWFCDRLASPRSREDYARDLKQFFRFLNDLGVHPYEATGKHVALFKEALRQAGRKSATIARALSPIRGAYEQLGKDGLVQWNVVGDIQAIKSPITDRGTTPRLSHAEAVELLDAPTLDTVIGIRDHALLYTYLKTAARLSAISNTTVGSLHQNDAGWYLVAQDKGGKIIERPLLEAAPAVLKWLDIAGVRHLPDAPLFSALERDRKTPAMRSLSRRQVLKIIKKYARQIGLNADRYGRRGICTHSLRKTAGMDSLDHGASVTEVQQYFGHADIRTTQEYITYSKKDIENAARRNQIRSGRAT